MSLGLLRRYYLSSSNRLGQPNPCWATLDFPQALKLSGTTQPQAEMGNNGLVREKYWHNLNSHFPFPVSPNCYNFYFSFGNKSLCLAFQFRKKSCFENVHSTRIFFQKKSLPDFCTQSFFLNPAQISRQF